MNPSVGSKSISTPSPARRLADTGELLCNAQGMAWDVIPGTDLDALWYGCRAALSLSKTHGASVRLFGDPQVLARLLPALDEHRDDQWWQGINFLDTGKLQAVAPAAMTLAIFEASVPALYQQRSRHHGLGSKILRLARLADSPDAKEHVGIDPQGRLFQGALPCSAGFIKPSPHTFDLRCVLRESAAGRAATIRRAGLSRDARPGERTIIVAAPASSGWREWISVWRNSEVPLRVLVLGGLGSSPALPREMRRTRDVEERNLSIAVIDNCSWSLSDELLWLSDLVLTNEEDLAIRAMACGVPVLYGEPESRLDPACAASSKVLGWQLRSSSATAALRGSMATLCIAWQSGRHIAEAWQRFSAVWDDAVQCAETTARWLRTVPDLLDLAVKTACERQQKAANERALPFPATVPMHLDELPSRATRRRR
ncbi:elongation factor P maturation arginine rhamnosyltransferase EarP [Burkholderiaceae bacterium UC74_6]